jgi:predicted TIM-barrel fold metal-dependent hydrolase
VIGEEAGVQRREFLAGLCAPALLLGGCRLSLEQGLLNECRAPGAYAPATRALVEGAWKGVRTDAVWDCHVHLFGNGLGGSGIWVEPEFVQPRTIAGRVRKAFFMNSGCAGEDEAGVDRAVLARITALADELPTGAKVMLLAFDATYGEDGERRDDLTTFSVPDGYARKVAASRPDRFEWIASIHPYRRDAVAALDAAKAGGARAVKWLPSTMAIDLAHQHCAGFYAALKRLDMPLLVHVGEEQAVRGAAREDLGNPLRVRHPLEQGVRVIAAHCATLGKSPDLEAAGTPLVENFALFERLMAERRYEKLLCADLSAVTQANRAPAIVAILARPEWEGRLLNGSDYPLPAILPIFSLQALARDGVLDARAIPALRELRQGNPLLFDFVLKRNLRHGGRRLPASAFETRPYFERGARVPA